MGKSVFTQADILMPVTDDMRSWSVIAGDQFSQDREYWDRVYGKTLGRLSAFNLIIPEVYENSMPPLDLAAKAKSVMESYIRSDVFELLPHTFIYVEREVTNGIRKGIIGAIDLEKFEYLPNRKAPIRASERTVAERLPAKMLIRENAEIETSSVIVFIHDKTKSVIEPLKKKTSSMRKLYDFELMEDGGRIRGWQVDEANAQAITKALEKLDEENAQLIVGDGNHTLAAAKELWERTKLKLTEEEKQIHPARFALAELNNLYDSDIRLEPVHRVMFNANTDRLIELMKEKLETTSGRPVQYVINGEKRGVIHVRGKSIATMIDGFQDVLEEYEGFYDGFIDYIHDEDAVVNLTHEAGCVGFIMPGIDKEEFISFIVNEGIFPKKSFSIGFAKDKRYYLECRRIKI